MYLCKIIYLINKYKYFTKNYKILFIGNLVNLFFIRATVHSPSADTNTYMFTILPFPPRSASHLHK